jgi:hypothetical protein
VSLIAGVGALNVLLLAIGYCVLAGPLWGKSAACWASYGGVALLAGAGVGGTGMVFAYICGAPNGAVALAAAAAVAAGGGAAAAASRRWRAWAAAPPAPARPAPSRGVAVLETALLGALAVVVLAVLAGGFRTTPWLDDVWGIWVPKGRTLDRLGLDARMLAPSSTYATFGVLHYPLWWPALTGLDLRFVRYIDLRAVDAQTALLVLAFFGAALRLLWGYVRPWVLGAPLLLLACSPEFSRHARGGLADLPLALYLSLGGLAAVAWIVHGRGFHLLLVAAFGATALQIKAEGTSQLLILAAFTLLLAWRVASRRLPGLVLTWALAFLSAVPWLVWRRVHGVHAEETVPLSRALSPSYLIDRSGRLGPSAETVARHLSTPHEWLFLVPLALALSLTGALRKRRALWLGPALLVAVLYLFWVGVYWTHPDALDYILGTSSYRTVDVTVLLAALALPLLAESLLGAPP